MKVNQSVVNTKIIAEILSVRESGWTYARTAATGIVKLIRR